MNVTETCSCGASITLSDSRGSYIGRGGEPDAHGDRYIWQKTLREFRDKHARCLPSSDAARGAGE